MNSVSNVVFLSQVVAASLSAPEVGGSYLVSILMLLIFINHCFDFDIESLPVDGFKIADHHYHYLCSIIVSLQ